MEEKEVERQLKEDAEKLKMKDFSERWEVIKDKIHPTVEMTDDEVLSGQKVLASDYGSHSESKGVKKKLLFGVGLIVLIVAVCLAIVLPIKLRKPQERFLSPDDLESKSVTESEFYAAIQSSELQIVDLSAYELDLLYIFTDDNGKVMGGEANVIDFENSSVTKLTFYSNKVQSELKIANDCWTCTIDGTKIKYVTSSEDGYYSTVALADSGTVIYELKCITSDQNVTAVFGKLFGNA